MAQERVDSWGVFRTNIIVLTIILSFIALGVRLYFLQIKHYDFYKQKAVEQQIVAVTIPAKRGNIYDVNGITLASREKSTTICLVPCEVDNKVDSVKLLSSALHIDPVLIRNRIASGKKLVYLKRKVSDRYAERIRQLGIPGIHFEYEERRNYPNRALFCHVLGIAGIDNQGLEGLEYYYNDVLTGKDGYWEINRSALSRAGSFIDAKRRFQLQEDGSDIYLTLDGYIQGITEEVLLSIQEQFNPDAISAVVVDPRNGKILAMANVPNFLSGAFTRFAASARKNRAVTDVYEPGSIMKVFTASAAIEQGINPEQKSFDCEEGVFYYRGRILHDHDPFGIMSIRDIIVYSSNIGIAKVGISLGKETVYSYLSRFGFGKKTGIPFPGESPGYLRPGETWDAFTLTSVPMGHEITCTALQIVMGISAIINGGILYRPQLIDRIVDSRGNVVKEFKPEKIRQVISEKTSLNMRDILKEVVERGTGKKARIADVSVGGKTGTAQLVIKDPVTGVTTYSKDSYLASFCGFAPVESPRICLIISVRNPKGSVYYGGSVAAPGVREIIQRSLEYISEPEILTVKR